MNNKNNTRVNLTLPFEIVNYFGKLAKKKGIKLGSFLRTLLFETFNKNKGGDNE